MRRELACIASAGVLSIAISLHSLEKCRVGRCVLRVIAQVGKVTENCLSLMEVELDQGRKRVIL